MKVSVNMWDLSVIWFFPLVIVLFLLINYIIKHSNNLNYLIVILHNFSQEAQQFNKMATKLKIVKIVDFI